MTRRRRTGRVALCTAVLLALATTVAAAGVNGGTSAAARQTADRPDGGDVLVVDADGSADFDTVQAGVDAADAGDTVRVRPGTYRETVTVEENVTIVAPQGATLNGSTLAADATAFELGYRAAPVVAGFTIVDYNVGLSAKGTAGDWAFRNATVENASFMSVVAAGTDGDWRLRNVTLRRTNGGVWAQGATGDWRTEDVAIRNVTTGKGIDALTTTGDWTVANVTVSGVEGVAVDASFSTGDWRVENSTLRDATVGIGARETSGDWAVWRSTVASAATNPNVRLRKPNLQEGVGVDASGANGSWTVRGSRLVDNEAGDVVAARADPAGDAAQNWWGDADDADCTGNVDCGNSLSTWPPESELPPPSIPRSPTPTAAADASATADAATPSIDASGTDGDGSAAEAAGDDAASAAVDETADTAATAADGSLPPLLTVAGLLGGGLVAGRRRHSRP